MTHEGLGADDEAFMQRRRLVRKVIAAGLVPVFRASYIEFYRWIPYQSVHCLLLQSN